MAVKRKKVVKKAVKPAVKKVELPKTAPLQVVVPPGYEPVVAHPSKNIVEIVPVPKAKRSLWRRMLFGG